MTRKALIWTLANQAYRKGLRIFGRFTIPVSHFLFRWYTRHCPQHFMLAMDRSIAKGIAYFERQDAITLDAALAFYLVVNRTYEPALGHLDDKVHSYAESWLDPHLRLLDQRYDPSTVSGHHASPVDLDQLHTVEKPILRCLAACHPEEQRELLQDLAALDDAGGYGTTHKLLGCLILKYTNPDLGAQLDAMIDSAIAPLLKAQQSAGAADIFYERAVLLQWLGRDQSIKPEWIVRIMRAQMRNGGWCWTPAIVRKAEQHPSSLGLTALIQFREAMRRRRGTSAAVPSRMGEAFSLRPVKPAAGKDGAP